ncbi:hypothetical protein NE865_03879 [Phthorimaea operculella]|nr:hypothetical protein NE865_03879 [Phthorimaea operculella]
MELSKTEHQRNDVEGENNHRIASEHGEVSNIAEPGCSINYDLGLPDPLPTTLLTSTPFPRNPETTDGQELPLPLTDNGDNELGSILAEDSISSQDGMAKNKEETTAKPLRRDSLLRIRTQIKQAKAVEAAGAVAEMSDDDEAQGNETASNNSGAAHFSDCSTRTVAGNRMILSEFPRNANRILQEAKEKLEASGNLRKDIREATVSALHTLYEMILRLADSRAHHIIEYQRLKQEVATATGRLAQNHSRALQKNLDNISELKTEISALKKDQNENQEAIRAIITRDLCNPLNELRKRAVDTGVAVNSMSSYLHDWKTTSASASGTALVQRKPQDGIQAPVEEGLLLELRAIHQDIARLERSIQNSTYSQKIMEAPCLDLEGIRETIQEVLVTTPITTIAPNLQPIIEDCRAHNDNLNKMGMRLGDLIQKEAQILQRTNSASIDALKTGIETLKETIVQVNRPTRTAIEEMRRELLEGGVKHDTLNGEERSLDPKNSTKEPRTNPLRQEHHEKEKSEPPLVKARHDNHTRSFAEVLNRPRYPLIIESADPRHTSNDVVQKIKDKIDVVQLGVGVNGLRKMRHQKVLITCDTDNDRGILGEAIKNAGEKLTVTQPATKNPLIRLQGVAQDLNDKRIEEAVLKQNDRIVKGVNPEERSVKVVRRIKGRIQNLNNVIIEVSPALWNKLRDQKLRIGYQIVTAIDQSPILQCYRCLEFGHKARDCQSKGVCCGYCTEEHDTRQCRNRNSAPLCINCSEGNRRHPAYSPECPVWQKWDRVARTTVNYC